MPSFGCIFGPLLSLVLATYAEASGKKINGTVYGEKASQEKKALGDLTPAQTIRLKKVFLFPSVDDLSGALAPKLDGKLLELLSQNTRFEIVRDPSVLKALSPDEDAYLKASQSEEVHREAAKITGADTTAILRTRNVGSNTQINFEFRDATGRILFSEEGSIPGTSSMDVRWGLVSRLYQNVLARLPFEGAVTGRTASTLTIDLGLGSIRQGEEIEIARVVNLQRHPLLQTVAGVDYVRTGRAKITTVDKVLSFAEILEEFPGEKISQEQKILKARATLIHRETSEKGESEQGPARLKSRGRQEAIQEPAAKDALDERLQGDFDQPIPRFGLLGANLYYGSISHSQSVAAALKDYSGGGVGGDISGELWVTKNWIFRLSYGFHGATLTGENSSAGDTSWKEFFVAGGYRIFPAGFAEGVVLTGSLGYQSMDFSIPNNASLSLGGKKYAGILVAVDGEINFLEKQKVDVGFALQPFASVTQSGASLGLPSGGTVIGVHLGWNRQIADELWFRVGGRYDTANGSYENSTNSISDKRFAFGPGIYYLF